MNKMTDSDPRPSGWHIYLDSHMKAVEIIEVAGGRAAVFLTGRPGKTTPNEDAALVAALDAESGVLGVADGAGGLQAGAEASRLAITHLTRELAGEGAGRALHERIVSGLQAAHDGIRQLGLGAATTFAGIQLERESLRTMHVGDSVVMVVGRKGNRRLQTVPHSPVGYAVQAGVLNEREAICHQDLHLVSNLLGVDTPEVEVGEPFRLEADDTVVIASDGLFDNLLAEEVAKRVAGTDLESAATNLVGETLRRMLDPDGFEPSKPDDLSLILFRFGA